MEDRGFRCFWKYISGLILGSAGYLHGRISGINYLATPDIDNLKKELGPDIRYPVVPDNRLRPKNANPAQSLTFCAYRITLYYEENEK